MDVLIKQHKPPLMQWRVFLFLMSFYTISVAQAADWIYEVRDGDNLWNITTDYLIDISYVTQLQKINNIADPWYIKPGTKIKIPKKWLKHFPSLIRVQNLQGSAHIIEEESNQSQPVKVGTVVMLGDTISTDSNSHLTLAFLDGTVILLLENSRLKIERLMLMEYTGMSDIQLKLEEGRLETQVIPEKGSARRFQIKTPATVTSVRGTDYRISAEAKIDKSNTEVLKGKVAVNSNHANHMLLAGFGSSIQKGQKPRPPVKLLAAPDVSNLPRLFSLLPIQFSISRSDKVESYRVQIAKTELFRDLLFNQLFSSEIIRSANLADGDYHLRIRAVDKQQLEGHNASFPFAVNALPEPPFVLTPKPGSGVLIKDKLNFSWTGQQDINNYHLQIAKDNNFKHIIIDTQDISDTNLSIAKQQSIGKYYWRIAAVDKDGDGPFSETQMFRRIIPAPKMEAPDFTDDSIIIRARTGLPGQSYQLQMADEDTFQQLLFDNRSDTPQFEIPKPSSGGEYFIRLRTIDPDGFIGPFSKPQTINIPYNLYWLLTLLPLLILIAL